MSLKTLCSQLARKPSSLDVMLLFDKPTSILQPICDLLDNWRYDEDQGEYQPVYEEFGSILLLVLSFTYRYNLSPTDLGIRTQDSFVLKLLNQGHLSRAMEDLTDQEQKHLDGWIRGLFDNESGGLGDELMSSCPPQDFYLLVPTLFHHIVLACSTKNLSDDSLKGGLEYLVDTFLLPSLIPGITWLSSHLWESRGDANAVLQILAALITNPASISNNTEASQMLNAILNIIAKNLEHSLRWLQRAEPSRQDVEPLSKALRGNLGWERRGAADHTELEGWTSSPGGGLVVAVKQTMANLVQWGLNPALNVNPAVYTHRQILIGIEILGGKRLLNTIVDEVKTQSEQGNSGVVFDIAVAMIAAPDPASWEPDPLAVHTTQPLQRRMTLREVLKIEAASAPKLHKTEPLHADTIVRLYRKVEAQLNMPMPQELGDLDGGVGIDAGLQEALDGAAGMDLGGMGDHGLGGGGVDGMGGLDGSDGLGGGMGMDMGEHGDLMQGLLDGGGGGVDLMGGFGGDDDLGDGMGF
jgi:mediator of RNA polymerase II transcription subunit 5